MFHNTKQPFISVYHSKSYEHDICKKRGVGINNLKYGGGNNVIPKIENLKRIEETGIVAVVRAENPNRH